MSQLDEMQCLGRCSKSHHRHSKTMKKFGEICPQKKDFEHLPKYCNPYNFDKVKQIL